MSKAKCLCAPDAKLVVACSGASNLGAIADRAARTLAREGRASMFCLAGIGARLPNFVRTAKSASALLAIDGCRTECARHCLESAGITEFEHIQLESLGLERGAAPITQKSIRLAVAAAAAKLSQAKPALGGAAVSETGAAVFRQAQNQEGAQK